MKLEHTYLKIMITGLAENWDKSLRDNSLSLPFTCSKLRVSDGANC